MWKGLKEYLLNAYRRKTMYVSLSYTQVQYKTTHSQWILLKTDFNEQTQTLITGKKQFLMIKEAPEWWKHPFWIYYNSFKTVHVNIHFDSLANNADTTYQIKKIIIKKPVFLFHTLSRDRPSHRSVSICCASVVCLACSSRRREWELWSMLSSANESVLQNYSESDENE